MSADWNRLAQRLDDLVARLERLVPAEAPAPDWKAEQYSEINARHLAISGQLEKLYQEWESVNSGAIQ